MKTFLIVLVIVAVAGAGYWLYKMPVEQMAEPVKVRSTYVTTGAEGVLAYAIKELELDKKHGIDLELQEVDPGETTRMLLARETDIGVFSPITAVRDGGHEEFRMIGPNLSALFGLVVKADSSYRSLADLKNARLAIFPEGSNGFVNIDFLLRVLHGVALKDNFAFVFGGIPDFVKHLNEGTAQAAFLPEPLASRFIASGAMREIIYLPGEWEVGYGVPYFFNGRAAHIDWIRENEQTARNFVAMNNEAIRHIKENPDFVAKYAMEVLGVTSEAEADFIAGRVPLIFSDRWGDNVFDDIMFSLRQAKQFGFIESELPQSIDELVYEL